MKKKSDFFLSENFHFFGGKIFSIFELAGFRNVSSTVPVHEQLCNLLHYLHLLAPI